MKIGPPVHSRFYNIWDCVIPNVRGQRRGSAMWRLLSTGGRLLSRLVDTSSQAFGTIWRCLGKPRWPLGKQFMATVISVSRNSNHSSYAHTPDRQTVAGWGDGELTKSKDITLSGPGILGKQKLFFSSDHSKINKFRTRFKYHLKCFLLIITKSTSFAGIEKILFIFFRIQGSSFICYY